MGVPAGNGATGTTSESVGYSGKTEMGVAGSLGSTGSLGSMVAEGKSSLLLLLLLLLLGITHSPFSGCRGMVAGADAC